MGIYDSIAPVQRRFRTKRMRAFAEMFDLTSETTILDVGGTGVNWELCPVRPAVTLLNVHVEPFPVPDGVALVIGDGRELPFGDRSFDIVYSNSTIEHVGSAVDQERFAREVQRVGRAYYVQTPNRRFPVEPHLLAPFVHWLPRRWQTPGVLRNATGWGLWHRPTAAECAWYDDILLLDAKEMSALFPDATIHRENIGGLTKSLIAVCPHS